MESKSCTIIISIHLYPCTYYNSMIKILYFASRETTMSISQIKFFSCCCCFVIVLFCLYNSALAPCNKFGFSLLWSFPGYSVSTLSDGSTEYFVAGAPRSNHSGQVIVYTVNAQKQSTIVDSERGKQVLILEVKAFTFSPKF